MAIRLSAEIVHFFLEQGYVIVSTIDKSGYPNNSCKGVVEIDANGYVYLFDLYRARTRENLKTNPHLSLTAIDEHKFTGYCLKGKVHSVTEKDISPRLVKAWEDRITSRLTKRLLKNVHGEKGHRGHPEALLPSPKYLICVEVEEIVDLKPQHLKKG